MHINLWQHQTSSKTLHSRLGNSRPSIFFLGIHDAFEVVPRKGIPHHIDPITKQPKYVDPAHRQCVPCFKATSFTPKNKKDKYNGRTHNCITTVKQNSGDIFAYPHPQILTGFKAPNAYGRTPLFDGTTTQAYFTHKVRKVGEEVDLGAKKLCPFDLMANRNQARAITHNDVGMSCFDRRNASYIRLTTGNPKDMKTPLTTHQRFHVLPKNSIGWNNPGIFADVDTEDTPEELGVPGEVGDLKEYMTNVRTS